MRLVHRISTLILGISGLAILILVTLFQDDALGTERNEPKQGITREVQSLTEWVMHAEDNQKLPFIVIDKKAAIVFVFESDGTLISSTPALLGVIIGDDSIAGVGKKKNADILLHERVTPAGRFTADLGYDINKTDLLWLDYKEGFSMHVVVTGKVTERRMQRLLSNDSADRRISYGCINVPSQFYYAVIQKTFANTSGIVYVLPEVHSIQKVFGPEAARFSQR